MSHKQKKVIQRKQPWSIASLLRKEDRDWLSSNDLRRRSRHHWFEREVLKAGEHPIRYAVALTSLFALTIVLGYVLPGNWYVSYLNRWDAAEQLGYFTSLWSVQATIAALVYPFVISFVTLLLQRRPSSNATLQIYLVDSGGLAAGLSSMFLVLTMAVQYFMLSAYSLCQAMWWVTVDSVWFILNIVFTVWFLFRTVEFLRSDFQSQVVKRYTINVALPREITNLLRFQFFANAQKNGWLPGPEYLDDEAEGLPQVLLGAFGYDMGESSVERHLYKKSRLTNVFYLPLRLAVSSWLKTAGQVQSVPETGLLEKQKSPLLVFPLIPGSIYEAEVVLARVEGAPKLSPLQIFLVRISFWFTPYRLERRHVTTGEILSEIETDARVSARVDRQIDLTPIC